MLKGTSPIFKYVQLKFEFPGIRFEIGEILLTKSLQHEAVLLFSGDFLPILALSISVSPMDIFL